MDQLQSYPLMGVNISETNDVNCAFYISRNAKQNKKIQVINNIDVILWYHFHYVLIIYTK